MTAIRRLDPNDYRQVFHVAVREHDPHDAPHAVRQAWSDYLGEQGVAELRYTRCIEELHQVVADIERLQLAHYRKIVSAAHARYRSQVMAAKSRSSAASDA